MSEQCPAEPCEWQCGYEGELNSHYWELCQEMEVCAATVDWERVFNDGA